MPRRVVLLTLVSAALGAGAVLFAPVDGTAAPKRTTYVYAHEGGNPNVVHGYTWAKDGSLEELASSPFVTGLRGTGCGGLCQTLGWSKKRRAVIVSGQDGVHVFLQQADGSLVSGAGSPHAVGAEQEGFNGVTAVDVGRRTFVYVNAYQDEAVYGFELGADGALTALQGSPWATGSGPDGILAVKRVLCCINERADSISSYAIGRDGTLTEAPGSPLAFPTSFSWSLHPDPRGRRVYAGENVGERLFGFSVRASSGELRELPASPAATGLFSTGSGVSAPKNGAAVVLPSNSTDRPLLACKLRGDGSVVPLGEPQEILPSGSSGHGRSPDGRFLVVLSETGLLSISVDRKSGAAEVVDTIATTYTQPNDLEVVVR